MSRELSVEERIVVRTPTDLSNVEFARDTQFGAHSLQFFSLQRFVLQAQPNLVQSTRVLAKSAIHIPCSLDVLLELCREPDRKPARQCSLPIDEFPVST